jgi:hypothetical protein
MPQSRQKKYIYTHKKQMKNIKLAMNLKERQSRKKKANKSPKVGNATQNQNEKISIAKMRKFTIEHDSKYETYKTSSEFKELNKNNPTIFVVNVIFLIVLKYSFIDKLLQKENKDIYQCLNHFILLSDKKSSIIEQLRNHGFNTIYDILLENPESVYLYSFLAYLGSIGLIEDSEKFVEKLKKNKLHKDMIQKEVIQQLQISNLYSRVKRFQLL